jgi:hypothetical protein
MISSKWKYEMRALVGIECQPWLNITYAWGAWRVIGASLGCFSFAVVPLGFLYLHIV